MQIEIPSVIEDSAAVIIEKVKNKELTIYFLGEDVLNELEFLKVLDEIKKCFFNYYIIL